MKVKELLRSKGGSAITVNPRAKVSTAIELLMRHGIGGVPVVTIQGDVVGFLAERDIVSALHKLEGNVRHLTVDRLMREPAPICNLEDSLHDVMERMTRERLRHLIVMDEGRIAGIISLGDIVKQRLEQAEIEASVLRDYVAGQRAR